MILFCLNNLKSFAEEISPVQENTTQENIAADTAETKTLPARAIIVDIDSERLDYFEGKDQFVATGKAKVDIKEQNSRLEADKVTFDQVSQLIIAEGNVVITKYGKVVHGEFARIDLSKESALIDDAKTVIDRINIKSRNANVYSDHTDLLKGTALMDNNDRNIILSGGDSMNGSGLNTHKNLDQNRPIPDFGKKPRYRIVAKDVTIDRTTPNTKVTIKNATIYLGSRKICVAPIIQIANNKFQGYTETNMPEIGFNQQLGRFAGPGYIFSTPNGATLKLAPTFAYGAESGSSIGGGLIARYVSDTNRTQFGFSTLKGKITVKGEQNLFGGNKTKIRYGVSDYVNNGIFGAVRPRYLMELADERKIYSGHNIELHSMESAGYAEDAQRTRFGTLKAQIQGNIVNINPLWSYKDLLELRASSQYNIAAYGTGDVFGMFKIGPNLYSHIGRLNVGATYFQGVYGGKSPFYYDKYLEGKSNFVFNTDFKVNKYINIGNYTSINLLKDNWRGQAIAINQIYTTIGPQDLKLRIGIDTVNKRSLFGFDLMLGSGYTAMDFDKLKIKQKNNNN